MRVRAAGVRDGEGASPARSTNDASRPLHDLLLLLDREDAQVPQGGQLVTHVGAQHLRAVGVDRVAHAVAPERVEDLAEHVPRADDARVEGGHMV
jgi:hypothetical protein